MRDQTDLLLQSHPVQSWTEGMAFAMPSSKLSAGRNTWMIASRYSPMMATVWQQSTPNDEGHEGRGRGKTPSYQMHTRLGDAMAAQLCTMSGPHYLEDADRFEL
ncbi:hypothetical protein PISMIDRAFT_461442 [Pisolithus microcarpus 441]|uniref:Uncharacterized protein n=1 Tax=Pisolithus microcarpus 441 TaxID=765257 RepID=A0A0C9YEB7_9AGAM|nr:hypothetical protein PISMIDRAFT_461442 [Pisolithus microcarpus 441]